MRKRDRKYEVKMERLLSEVEKDDGQENSRAVVLSYDPPVYGTEYSETRTTKPSESTVCTRPIAPLKRNKH